MATHNLLDTNTVSVNEIFTNGKIYRVPLFQRDYSWKAENWDDLWADILTVSREGNTHYMGAIVFQEQGDKYFGIIDGQQRLATLSIVILAAIKTIQNLIEADIEPEENQERIKLLRERYVGSKDAASLRYSSKLFLNEKNDPFYQSNLLQLRAPNNPHRLNSSEKLLWQAYEYFYGKLSSYFDKTASGQEIAGFISDLVAERLLFIQIIVKDELDAYTVFETLNARGVELTITDLLKNYLLALSAQSPIDQRQAKAQWDRIVQITDLDDFPKFLRHYWNSRFSLVRKENLFKVVRNSVKNKDQSFTLLDELEKSAAVYVALDNPNDELWGGRKEIINLVRELRLFRVTQGYPLLLNVYAKMPLVEFEKVLHLCVVISFRYNVISGLNPNEQEIAYNRAARKVFMGALINAQQVAKELSDIYLNDEAFGNAFASKSINTNRYKKLVRYILYELEKQMAESQVGRDFELDSGTIEHILPENADEKWGDAFSGEEQPNYIYRLGNLTLLEAAKNRDCERKEYAEKLAIYHTSDYVMTERIDYPDWTPIQLRARQEKLANYAKSIWSITY